MNDEIIVTKKDIQIASLRKQLQEATKKINALELEIAYKDNEIIRLKSLTGDRKK